MSKNVVVLPGDGVGPEVVGAAVDVMQAVGDFSFNFKSIGGYAIDKRGESLPETTLKACQGADAVLLGAVGGPQWESDDPEAPRPEQGLLALREGLNVHANLRPTKVLKSLVKLSALNKEKVKDGVDFMMVRELLGGLYFGEKGRDHGGSYDVCRYTDQQIKNVGRTAFELSVERSVESGHVPRLVSVDKANVLETSRRWRELMEQLHLEEYPMVFFSNMLVDNAAQQLNINPRQFDVIVTENTFGDILSDQAATLTGSVGLSPSASLSRDGPGLFEPIHGSAPDLAADRANPVGAILSGAMALRYSLDMPEEASAIEAAVEKTLAGGLFRHSVRTEDIGGRATTRQMTQAVLRNL
jgi:3-isopropylmalate dehydrogenase